MVRAPLMPAAERLRRARRPQAPFPPLCVGVEKVSIFAMYPFYQRCLLKLSLLLLGGPQKHFGNSGRFGPLDRRPPNRNEWHPIQPCTGWGVVIGWQSLKSLSADAPVCKEREHKLCNL